MQQSPSWETNNRSSSQEIPHRLWNQKVHYRVHRSPPLDPILHKINPVHISGLHGPGPRPDPARGSGPREVAQIMFGFGPGSNDRNLNISGFLGPFFFRKEKFIRSCAHVMLLTVTKLRSSTDRSGTTCELRIVQRFTMGLHAQVYWQLRMFLQCRQMIHSRLLTFMH
jgi:hypothetical protein